MPLPCITVSKILEFDLLKDALFWPNVGKFELKEMCIINMPFHSGGKHRSSVVCVIDACVANRHQDFY